MHDNPRNQNGNGNGTRPAAVEPEIVHDGPATGQVYPMPRGPLVPPGCMIVRKEICWAAAGAIGGAIVMWLIVRELRGGK